MGHYILLGTKVVRSWYGTDSHELEDYVLGIPIGYMGLILVSIFVTARKLLVHKEVLVIVVSLSLYYWSMSVLFEPLVRYLIPALGLWLIVLPGLWVSNSRKSATA